MLLDTLAGTYFDGNGYAGPIVLVISACDSGQQTLTPFLSRAHQDGKLESPPTYVFLIADPEVYWADAVVTWTIFYRKALDLDFRVGKPHKPMKEFITHLKCSNYGNLAYFRWDPNRGRYLRFPKVDSKQVASP